MLWQQLASAIVQFVMAKCAQISNLLPEELLHLHVIRNPGSQILWMAEQRKQPARADNRGSLRTWLPDYCPWSKSALQSRANSVPPTTRRISTRGVLDFAWEPRHNFRRIRIGKITKKFIIFLTFGLDICTSPKRETCDSIFTCRPSFNILPCSGSDAEFSDLFQMPDQLKLHLSSNGFITCLTG